MIVVTPGEPAGIGPDLVIQAAQQAADSAWAVVADVDMLRNRAQQLGLPVQVYDDPEHQPSEAGDLNVIHTPLARPVVAGQLDPDNAQGVLDALDAAIAVSYTHLRAHETN